MESIDVSRCALVLVPLVAIVTLAGCVEIVAESASRSLPAPQDMTPANDAATDDEDERQRLLIAWLQSDLDKDGLSAEFELKYGLDPDDPTDGPDIDGDGIPNYRDNDVDGDGVINETDPDIDGDGIANGRDRDVDGDAVPDEIDFDMDSDGIRNEWDLDDDSDGNEDLEPIAVPEFLAEDFLEVAAGAMSDEDDDSDDDDDDDWEKTGTNHFEAYIEHLLDRVDNGDASAQDDLKGMLRQVSGWAKHPIKPNGYEAKVVMDKLADRFKESEQQKAVIESALKALVPTRTGLEKDATDAVDVLFRQVIAIKDPKGSKEDPMGIKAGTELVERLSSVVVIAQAYGEADLPACSDAVNKLSEMSGEGNLAHRLAALENLAKVFDEPELDKVVTTLGELAIELDGADFAAEWTWDDVAKALETAPHMAEEGDEWELGDHVVDKVLGDKTDEDDHGDNDHDDEGESEGDGDNEEQP